MIDLRRWPHADDILDEALAQPRDRRSAVVRGAAGDDVELIAAIEAVLAEADETDAFLRPGGAFDGAVASDLVAVSSEQDSPSRLSHGARFGAYEVQDVIGRGGMGEVYRARDPRLGRDVALKVLPLAFASDRERHARFEREARTLAAINHPNIAAIYEVEEHDGVVALVLELVQGETLAARIARGRLSITESIDIAGQVVDALEAAHARGVVHRDLKPANISVTPQGIVKVLDFGIAKAMADDTEDVAAAADRPDALTTAAHGAGVLGTAAYISPERARGLRTDHRADIWAFGCVLFEMLAGVRAFGTGTGDEVLARVLARDPELSRLPVRTPASLIRLLERTFRKDPARRLGYIGDARLDLDDARIELTGPADAVPTPLAWRRRFTWGVSIAAGLGIVGGAAGVWQITQPSVPPVAHLAVPVADADDLVAGELPGLALSPDGRIVVYRTRRAGVIQLVARALEEAEGTVLSDSTDGASPFFSPDGRWIGFTSGSSLRKVPVGGGPSVEIAPAPGGARASWADDETIWFSTGTGHVIYRVRSSGGTPAEVTRLDRTAGHMSHGSPEVLPGGRSALVTIGHASGSRIGVARLDTGEVREIAEGREARYLPSGAIVFARGHVLWAARFDTASLALASEPVPVLSGVEASALSGTSQFAITRAGGLVYLPARPALDLRKPIWIDRDGGESPVAIDARPYTRAALSPDGSQIALAVASADDRDIWIQDLERGTFMRLTTDPATDTAPVWSPDRQHIAFRSERDGGGVFMVRADGSGPVVRLTRSDGPQRPAHTPYAFTPDGGAVLFGELRSYSDQGIGLVTIGSPPQVSVLIDGPFAEARPALSPDGKWLAYQSDESGRFEIYVRPYPSVTTSRVQVSSNGGTSARWSLNGRELFFFDGRAIVTAAVIPGPAISFRRPHALFDASAFAERLGPVYDVAADGRFLFLARPGPGGAPARRGDLRLIANWSQHLPVQLDRVR